MKELLSLILVLTLSVKVKGQEHLAMSGSDHYSIYGDKSVSQKVKRNLVEQNVRTIRVSEIAKNGTPHLESEMHFDERGNWIERRFFHKNGKQHAHWKAQWSESNKMLRLERSYRGDKTFSISIWEYDDKDQMTHYKNTRKGKASHEGVMTYRDTLLMEAVYAKRGHPNGKWKYIYYDDGQLKQSIYYNKKGEEKHRWNYACDTEGELLKKRETEVCKKTDVGENGLRKEIYQYNDDKRKIRKMVLTFDREDHLIEAVRYDKKDKMFSQEVNTFDPKGNRNSYTFYIRNANKPRSEYQFEYNMHGLMIAEKSIKPNGKTRHTFVKEYN